MKRPHSFSRNSTIVDGCRIIDKVWLDCRTVKYLWGLLTRDDGVGFSLKNNVSVHRLCFRALRAQRKAPIFCHLHTKTGNN